MNNWGYFFDWIDMFFSFFANFKIYGISILNVLIAITFVSMVLSLVLLKVDSDGD